MEEINKNESSVILVSDDYDEHKKQVALIMSNVKTGDSNGVIQYGVGAQSDIASFSDKMI